MLTTITNFLLPNRCLICQKLTRQQNKLCHACAAELPWLNHTCYQCSIPLTNDSSQTQHCGQCLQKPPLFQRTIALFRYEAPIKQLLLALKFHNRLLNADLLGKLLAQRLLNLAKKNRPDCLIPMPLHKQRLVERGYNQAVEIARPISKALLLPIELQHCQRIIPTQAQSGLSTSERQQNVKNAFRVSHQLAGKHVAIIDDIVTTSATINELSQALHKKGVRKIDIWCCVRTSK